MSKYRKECWTDADVRCPFYISDERSARSITCEGCMEETMVVRCEHKQSVLCIAQNQPERFFDIENENFGF